MKLALSLSFFVGLSCCLDIGTAQDQPDHPRQLKLGKADLSVSGELVEQEDGIYRAQFDLGRIQAGKNAVMDLKVNNPYDRKINFSGVSKKCKCSNFRPDRYYFSPNEELNVRVRLKLPMRRNSKTAQTTMLIVNRDVPVAELVFEYELNGMLSFTELIGIIGFNSDKQTRTLEMPFIATQPVDLEKLTLINSANLDGCQFELIKQEEGGIVKVTADDSILKKSKIRGDVMIMEKGSNRRDTFFLTIKNEKLAEISPSVVTFKNNGGKLVATATLKMAKAVVDDAELQKIELECRHNGTAVSSSLRRLSDKLVQVILTAGNGLDQATTDSATLQWTVMHQGSTTNLETPFVVAD